MAGTVARRPTGYRFILQTQQRQALAPLLLALLAKRHVHARIAVVIAGNAPFKPERNQCRWINREVTCDRVRWMLRKRGRDQRRARRDERGRQPEKSPRLPIHVPLHKLDWAAATIRSRVFC